MVWLMLRRGWRMPLPDPERATRRLIRHATRLSRSIHVPVLLENTPPLPFEGYDFEARPERITEVIEKTGCGLVLDTGHARLAAETLGLDVCDYVSGLPLDRVVQVHVSGPRERDGRLFDAHESLQDVDYALLSDVLETTSPQALTLEYIRERDTLREQLCRLRDLLEPHPHLRNRAR
jgi:uncharacterized protein (UPF0276 family)